MKERQHTTGQPVAPGSGRPLPISANAAGTAFGPPSSDKEKAGQLFEEVVEQLPGVLRVERWDGAGHGAPTFHIYLRPEDRDAEYAVYELKGQVYDRYPEAYLDVVVLETNSGPISDGESGA